MRYELAEEGLQSLLAKEDCFFYQSVYDPRKKSIQTNKYSIRVGSDFQATVPDKIGKKFVISSRMDCVDIPCVECLLVMQR